MKVLIGIISLNEELNNFFIKSKEKLINKNSLEKLNKPNLKFASYNPTQYENKEIFARELFSSTSNYDYVTIIADENLDEFYSGLQLSFLIGKIRIPEEINLNYNNFLTSCMKKLIKSFIVTYDYISQFSYEHAMTLPVKNFKADELDNLRINYEDMVLNVEFNNNIRINIAKLRSRKTPIRHSSTTSANFKDDDDKVFSYGPETHSTLETSNPPHNIFCVIRGNFRFGKKIATNKHFNVCSLSGKQTIIKGDFIDCHNQHYTANQAGIKANKNKHLNIFANDYFDWNEKAAINLMLIAANILNLITYFFAAAIEKEVNTKNLKDFLALAKLSNPTQA